MHQLTSKAFPRLTRGAALAVVLVFGVAACGGDDSGAADSVDTPANNVAAANPCAANPCAANPCAANPCAAVQELPEGVTQAMLTEGKAVFEGAGICSSCHGVGGVGIPNLGADLTDAEWIHSDGSYDGIIAGVTEGVSAEKSTSGVPMPPKGGTNITEDQVKAVSAYVWTLSKG